MIPQTLRYLNPYMHFWCSLLNSFIDEINFNMTIQGDESWYLSLKRNIKCILYKRTKN